MNFVLSNCGSWHIHTMQLIFNDYVIAWDNTNQKKVYFCHLNVDAWKTTSLLISKLHVFRCCVCFRKSKMQSHWQGIPLLDMPQRHSLKLSSINNPGAPNKKSEQPTATYRSLLKRIHNPSPTHPLRWRCINDHFRLGSKTLLESIDWQGLLGFFSTSQKNGGFALQQISTALFQPRNKKADKKQPCGRKMMYLFDFFLIYVWFSFILTRKQVSPPQDPSVQLLWLLVLRSIWLSWFIKWLWKWV